MSGSLLNNYSQLDSNILEVQLTLDASRVGMHQVSLTNYDSTSESQIAAGSIIEVGGALYKFTANETITGSPSDGTVYIMIVPSGTTCTAEYTNTAPTWSDSKQGYYGTGGSANYRYLEFLIYKSSTSYFPKNKFQLKYKTSKWETGIEIYLSSDQTVSSTSDTVILFNLANFDYNSDFNTGTNRFICSRKGLYRISGTISPRNITSPDNNTVKLRVDGTAVYTINQGVYTTDLYHNIPINKILSLNVNQYIDFTIDSTTDTSYSIESESTIILISQI